MIIGFGLFLFNLHQLPELGSKLHEAPGSISDGKVVVITCAFTPDRNKAGCFENFQMMRDSRTGQARFLCDFPDIQAVQAEILCGEIIAAVFAGGIREDFNDGQSHLVAQSDKQGHTFVKLFFQLGPIAVIHGIASFGLKI